MSDRSESPALGWLKIGGIGCGALVLLLLLLAGALVTVTYRGYGRALEIRETLDARYGAPDAFEIPAGGAIPASRMTRFLAVRRALLPRCERITDTLRPFRSVAAEARAGKPDTGSLFQQVVRAIRQLPTIGLVFGDYVEARNRALLEQEMSLGEYSFIFVAGYVAYLRQAPSQLFGERSRSNTFEDRVFPDVAAAISRHVSARGLTQGPWVAERDRLRSDPGQTPFANGLPPELEASFSAFRDALVAAACPAAAELDVTITVRRGSFGYDHK